MGGEECSCLLCSLPPRGLTITHPLGVPGAVLTEKHSSTWTLQSDTLESDPGYPICLLCAIGQMIKPLGNSVSYQHSVMATTRVDSPFLQADLPLLSIWSSGNRRNPEHAGGPEAVGCELASFMVSPLRTVFGFPSLTQI